MRVRLWSVHDFGRPNRQSHTRRLTANCRSHRKLSRNGLRGDQRQSPRSRLLAWNNFQFARDSSRISGRARRVHATDTQRLVWQRGVPVSKCKGRIKQQLFCPECSTVVQKADLLKGYEYQKNQYVIVSESELTSAEPKSAKILELSSFVPASQLAASCTQLHLAPVQTKCIRAANGAVGSGRTGTGEDQRDRPRSDLRTQRDFVAVSVFSAVLRFCFCSL
jgi:hypothetical protein